MKPAPFDYAQPASVAEALAVLGEHGGDARVLAGGQSLGAMLNMRLVSPRVLVDVSRLGALGDIREDAGSIVVGASVTQRALETWTGLAARQPLLAAALPWVGHHATRQRGTVVGSIVHSDPSSELPLVLAMLDGTVELRRGRGSRTVPASAFQTGMLQTDVAPGELAVAVRFPVAAPGTVARFTEVSQRHGDFAIVALAAVGRPHGVRLGVGGVADVPAVRDYAWDALDEPDDALNELAWSLDAADDAQATARYRRALVRRLGRRLIEEVRDALPGR